VQLYCRGFIVLHLVPLFTLHIFGLYVHLQVCRMFYFRIRDGICFAGPLSPYFLAPSSSIDHCAQRRLQRQKKSLPIQEKDSERLRAWYTKLTRKFRYSAKAHRSACRWPW
jgi:hypothetical protein